MVSFLAKAELKQTVQPKNLNITMKGGPPNRKLGQPIDTLFL